VARAERPAQRVPVARLRRLAFLALLRERCPGPGGIATSVHLVCPSATTILRVALGEIQTVEARANKALSDEEAQAIVRKLVKSNEETLAAAKGEDRETLERENTILLGLLPATLNPDEIVHKLVSIAEEVRAAKNDGQATGVAMKHLKAAGARVQGADVTAAVKRMRA
jgi:uncharacterized protein YqeY